MNFEMLQRSLIIMFSVFLFVVAIVPFIIRLAKTTGAVDKPRGRHKHKKPTPKLGGLAIFFGFLFGYILFGNNNPEILSIMIAGFVLVLFGVIDDYFSLDSKTQFLAQIIAAAIIVFYGGLLIKDISAFGLYIDFGVLSYAITLFFIVGCINCIALIDGLDGLSSGISAIYFLTISIICVIQGKFGFDFTLSLIMLGAVLGFLIYNFEPAAIFAGESGAQFMGLMISVIALLGFKNVTLTSLITPLLIIALPILDVLFAIIRRSLKGVPFNEGDYSHIHHQLMKRTLSTRTTVLIIYGIQILFSTASILYFWKSRVLGYIVYGVLTVIIILFVVKTDVVFTNSNDSKKEVE